MHGGSIEAESEGLGRGSRFEVRLPIVVQQQDAITTGDTGKAALRVASYYETRLDRSIARATAIIGPIVLLTVSALIAWIIVSVITALLSLNELLL